MNATGGRSGKRLSPTGTSEGGTGAVRALERGLRIIKCFDVDHPSWRIADLSREVGFHRATTRRLLKTLEGEGFLTVDPDSAEYRLGSALLSVAYLARSHDQLIRVAHKHIEWLAVETEETVGMAVWTDRGILHLDHIQTTHFFKPVVHTGNVSTIYGTTHSQILLAFGPGERLSKLSLGERSNDLTLADMTKIQRELDEVRRAGIAWDLEDYIRGVCAVGVPIKDSAHDVVASLSVIAPADRFGPDHRERIASRATEAGVAISRELGFRE